jgi:single stranded DNA-binding protein
MSNTNIAVVTGNLGQDPVVEESRGTRYGRFSLANNERFTSKATGAVKAHTNWIQIVVFGNLTNSLLHLTKGDKVTVTGRLHTDSRIRPEDGAKIPTFEIHAQAIDFIKVKGRAESDDTATEGEGNGGELPSPDDDDIPF